MKYYKYDVYNYDVWGNKSEGFEVNDVFKTDNDIVISQNIVESDIELIKALKKLNILKKGLHSKSIEIEGDSEYTLYFNDIRKEAGYFKPAFEMRCNGVYED